MKHTTTPVAAAFASLLLTASPAAADGTNVGVAVGAAIPATGIGLHDVAPAVSGWLTRPIAGPWGWRAEVGRARLQLPDATMFRCSAAGFFCDANLTISSVSGGLQFDSRAATRIAPYGYVTIGVYHLTAQAEAQDVREGTIQFSDAWSDNAFGLGIGSGVRVRVGSRWTVRAELRYAGFTYEPGTVHWASVLTPALNVALAF
jgi:hypothetical protein